MEENLLLKDICARLPYDVEAQVASNIKGESKPFIENKILTFNDVDSFTKKEGIIISIKPFLRPMSSVTEAEKEEYDNAREDWYDDLQTYDWLLEHHFDYRYLIEKGLALEAPKNMYN